MAYNELRQQAIILKTQIVNEINTTVRQKGYMDNEPCTCRDDYNETPTTVWLNKYGDGMIVSVRGKDELHINSTSIDDSLIVLEAVNRADKRR